MKSERFTVLEGNQGGERVTIGIGSAKPKARLIRLRDGQAPVIKRVAFDETGTPLAELVRKGYVVTRSNQFFDEMRAAFVEHHPDLARDPSGQPVTYVLYAQVPNMEDATLQVDRLLGDGLCDAGITRRIKSDYLREVGMADETLVAYDSHPAWALVIAQVARDNGWVLAASRPGLPKASPRSEPLLWATWLKEFFVDTTIYQALTALGWSPAAKLATNSAAPQLNASAGTTAADYL